MLMLIRVVEWKGSGETDGGIDAHRLGLLDYNSEIILCG
jgi:hypothetical protein